MIRQYVVTPGMSYQVADDDGSPHRVLSERGATVFDVVGGHFPRSFGLRRTRIAFPHLEITSPR
jgi:hypothetical protein